MGLGKTSIARDQDMGNRIEFERNSYIIDLSYLFWLGCWFVQGPYRNYKSRQLFIQNSMDTKNQVIYFCNWFVAIAFRLIISGLIEV